MSLSAIRREKILVLLVPALLCVVAGIQIFLVQQHSLSRWKGGGFGMFTTVDSPSARFLRIYLITDNKEVPVLVPPTLRKLSSKVRVMPTTKRLTLLAQRLREGVWVPLTMVSTSQYHQDMLRAAGDDHQDSADNIRFQSPDAVNYLDFSNINLYRMLENNEPTTRDTLLAVSAVRIEVWKYNFDKDELVLRAEKLTEVQLAGDHEQL